MQSNSCKEKTHCTIGRENLQIQQPQSKTQQVKKSAAKTKVTHHPVSGQNFIAGWLAHSAAICDTVFMPWKRFSHCTVYICIWLIFTSTLTHTQSLQDAHMGQKGNNIPSLWWLAHKIHKTWISVAWVISACGMVHIFPGKQGFPSRAVSKVNVTLSWQKMIRHRGKM